jgi:hypothetical protein
MNARNPARGRSRRRGYGLVEVAMAVFVLMIAMSLMVKALALTGVERRAADRRLWAVEAASNVLERVTAEPFGSVTAEKARSLADEAEAGRVLPGAAWEFDVRDEPGAPVGSKRLTVRLRWKDRSGGWESPVRLTAWVYRGRGRS